MFKKQSEHETGVKRKFIEATSGRRYSFQQIVHLRKRGASFKTVSPKMENKVRRCYPRGGSFLRMVDLHTVEQLSAR